MKFLAPVIILMMLSGCATAPSDMAAIPAKTLGATYPAIKMFPYPAAKGLFAWPVRGDVLAPYGAKIGMVKNKGVDIRCPEGDRVRAAGSGKVVYCDPYLKGFGKTIIIDHGNSYQTVYSYNMEILVNVGDSVKQGEVIARAGRTGRATEPSLHFEVRKDGEPQNPMYYLSR